MGQLNVINPFDGSPVGEVQLSSESDVDLALTIAEKTHKANRKGLPRHERAAILKRAALLMKGRTDELALLIASEGGKPLIDARVEVERAIDGVEAILLHSQLRRQAPNPCRFRVQPWWQGHRFHQATSSCPSMVRFAFAGKRWIKQAIGV